ncbi:MAG TPA: glycosyltransferase [Zeimonas sp.]|nr:glycosyltransferase [Zeimonas sp.]
MRMTRGDFSSSGLSVIHVVPGLHPRSGGPSRTVVQLTDALAIQPEVVVTLLSQSLVGEPAVPSKVADVDRRLAVSCSSPALRLALPIRRELGRAFRSNRPAVVHSHGLWAPAGHWASRAARRHGIPLVIHPRGMLEPWALGHKAWKKRIGMALFQRNDLDVARVLIATSSQEYENIRKLGLRQPVAVIPNGVDLAVSQRVGNEPPRRPERVRSVLFLSRIHPKKGLLNLMHAWASLAPRGWHLRIAGPDEGGHLAEVMALAQRLGIAASVDHVGEVDGKRKSETYRDADVFVLPTFSENFGVVVAEALAYGLPVITTRGAPWADLETERCGWWIDIGVEPLVDALRAAMALGDEDRRAMGERGREYVRRYDWNAIARDTVGVYSWILGKGPRPECVALG